MSTIAVEQGSTTTVPAAVPILSRRGTVRAVAVGGLLVTIGGFLLLATSDHLVDPIAYGAQIAVMVAGSVAATVCWLVRRPGNRLGLALLGLSAATATMFLQGASQPLLHSLGVAVEPVYFLLSYYVVFAFPDGRLGGLMEKVLLGAMTLYFLTGFVPYLFFSPVVPGGSSLAGCNEACPTNALMISDNPRIAASYGSDGSYAVIAIMSGTLICLAYRLATASRPQRRALLPVYLTAVMLTIPTLIYGGVVTQLLHLDPRTIWKVGWVLTIARCALPYGFVLAIVQTSLFAAAALKGIVTRLGGNPNAAQLRTILADALDDPSLELAFRAEPAGQFVDSRGNVIDPTPKAGRSSTALGRDGDTVAVIVHDPALDNDPELVGVAGEALLLALENGRLVNELNLMDSELRETRARIVSAGDAERRKIERDLHDGAQQHLVALRIKVGLASELAGPEVAPRLAEVGTELEEILEEFRNLAQGLYPPTLRQFGLKDALSSVARRSVPPATLEVAPTVDRYPDDIETAVYFCCVESLQNVGKHAGSGARAVIRLWENDGLLSFEVEDDGAGYDVAQDSGSGAGSRNMADRMASVGGTLAVESSPARGTTVRGSLPVAVPTAR